MRATTRIVSAKSPRSTCLSSCLLASLVIPLALGRAQSDGSSRPADISVGLLASTVGVQLEGAKLLSNHLAVRAAGSFFRFNATHLQSDINYDATIKLGSFAALLDVYPGSRGTFHFTGGLTTNPVRASGNAVAVSGDFKINGHSYTPDQVGVLSAHAKFPGVMPYLGLGFGTPTRGSRVEFLADLGAAIGKPTVTMDATGAATNAQLAADVTAQAATTQHDIRRYAKVFPVFSLGLAYRL